LCFIKSFKYFFINFQIGLSYSNFKKNSFFWINLAFFGGHSSRLEGRNWLKQPGHLGKVFGKGTQKRTSHFGFGNYFPIKGISCGGLVGHYFGKPLPIFQPKKQQTPVLGKPKGFWGNSWLRNFQTSISWWLRHLWEIGQTITKGRLLPKNSI